MSTSELIIEQLQIGPMQNFVYVVGSRATREVVLVDPAWDIDALSAHLAENDYTLKGALVTHYHPDHIGGGFGGRKIAGLAELLAKHPVKIYAHRDEADGVRKVTGISESDLVRVDSGDQLNVGDIEVEFLHTPGSHAGVAVFSHHATRWYRATRCSFRDAVASICPAPIPSRCITACANSPRCPTTRCCCRAITTAKRRTQRWAKRKRQNPYLRIDDLGTWKQVMG